MAETSRLHGTVIDAADCPDIIPVLTVAAAVAEGTTEIINAGRCALKECRPSDTPLVKNLIS